MSGGCPQNRFYVFLRFFLSSVAGLKKANHGQTKKTPNTRNFRTTSRFYAMHNCQTRIVMKIQILVSIAIAMIFSSPGHAQTASIFDAARKNDVETIKKLVAEKSNLNEQNARGFTPLIIAIYNGSDDAAKLLLENKADVHLKDKTGNNALMAASFRGGLSAAKLLLEHGAKANDRNLAGATALMFASMTGKKEMVEFLLDKGADASLKDDRGNSALSLAEQQGADEVAEVLRKRIKKN